MDTAARCILFALFTLLSAYLETVCTSLEECNRIRIKQLAEDGSARARLAERLLSVYKESFFTLKAAKGASMIAELCFMYSICREGYSHTASLVMSALIVILVSVTFTGYLPGSIARAASDKIILAAAIPTVIFTIPVLPLTLAFALFVRLCALIMPRKSKELAYTSTYTEDELSDIIEKVEDEGVLLEEESDIIQSAVDFGSVSAPPCVPCPLQNARNLSEFSKNGLGEAGTLVFQG